MVLVLLADDCKRCGLEFPVAELVKDSSRKLGYKPLCKGCDRLKSNAYHAANRDKRLAYHRSRSDLRKAQYAEKVAELPPKICKHCRQRSVRKRRHWYCEVCRPIIQAKKEGARGPRTPEKRLWDAERYGHKHTLARKRWATLVEQGGVRCARGADCFYVEHGLAAVISPHELWDLGHGPDGEIWGPEHRRCNRATARWTKPESPRSREW